MSDAPSRRGFFGRLFGILAAMRLPIPSRPHYSGVLNLGPLIAMHESRMARIGTISEYIPGVRRWDIDWSDSMSFQNSPLPISTSDPVPAADDVTAPVLTIAEVNAIDFGRNVCFDDQLAECIKAEGSINHPPQVELLLDDVM